MRTHKRLGDGFPILKIGVAAALLGTSGSAAWANGDEDEEEIPFDEAEIFFELNNTDGDLGIHALIDGDAWKKLEIEAPDEREMLQIRVKSRLRRQGLTELFFESAEPSFDELAPEQFFRRFPEGEYEISGITIEGEERESDAEVTHVMPAPPQNITVSGVPAAEDCDADPLPSVGRPVIISWDPVIHSHPELGKSGVTVDVVRYQLVLEREEPELLIFSVELPPGDGVTPISFQVPEDFVALGDEFKFEVLVREASYNQTAVESCFELE